ncbi:MAG: hypothetical protein QOI24_1039 [Acidobacteriota bacterium]|jgi:hypothetical protein|nr:hypothetical protein [Acidobacteriota bacterium]
MRNTLRTAALLLFSLTLASNSFAAAKITIKNTDAAGVGFNDATAAAPVGGNPGTTVGQQRMNAFLEAARIWGEQLDSPIEITIDASFAPLSCTATSGTLGSAGPTKIVSDFPNAPKAGVWYPMALANKLAGENLDPGNAQIRARFNGNLGNTGCLERSKWYYGLDNNHGRDTDLVVVLLHEFAHGLGIIGGITINDPSVTPGPNDPVTGTFRSNGKPFIYDLHALDNVTGLRMDQMSDAQRAAAVTADQKVVWDGDAVRPAAANLLLSVPRLTITSASGTSSFEVAQASFGASVKASGVTAPIIVANDAVEAQSGSTAAGTTLDGCSSYSNAAAVAGNFAIVNEGRCTDVEKAKRAQEAGAIGLLIAAKAVTVNIYTPIGFEPSITIPVLGMFKNDGDAVRAAGTVTGSAFPDLTKLTGADTNGHPKLYMPVTAEPGSTYSHFDRSATPNLLMEPSINGDLTHSTDLTLSMLLDIGWGLVITPPPVITGRRFLKR